MNLLGLVFFCTLHWIIVLFPMLYIFFRQTSKYDTIYFITICAIMVSWIFTGSECIISYFEKLCLDENYKYGSNIGLPFIDQIFGEKLHYCVLGILLLVTSYTLYKMMAIYKVPFPIMLTILMFYTQPVINKAVEVIRLLL